MTDYAELKRLAEACPQNDPLRLVDYSGTWYLRNTAGTVFEVRRNSSFPEFKAVNEAYGRLVESASPAAILALLNELQNLRTVQRASFNASGQIKAAASELGFNPAQEKGALEYLIGLAREVTGLREKCARLEEDNEAMWENPGDLL